MAILAKRNATLSLLRVQAVMREPGDNESVSNSELLEIFEAPTARDKCSCILDRFRSQTSSSRVMCFLMLIFEDLQSELGVSGVEGDPELTFDQFCPHASVVLPRQLFLIVLI